MTTRYVGSGGNDLNNGTSWATRKLTLNGVEDTPVVAGDTVYVGAGVYRELLTCDVSGTAGSPISYIGDYDGSHTDGVGGVVRITGSDDDQTATRANCITATSKDYRTFQGFTTDTCASHSISVNGATNWTISNCIGYPANGLAMLYFTGVVNNIVMQNCTGMGGSPSLCRLGTAAQASSGNIIQNCISIGGSYGYMIYASGTTMKNCHVLGGAKGIYVDTPGGAEIVTVNNSTVLFTTGNGMEAAVLGELVENYNNIYGCAVARANVAVGANSVAYPPLWDTRWFFEMVNGGRFVTPFDLGAWSQLINLAGTSPPATDMRGTAVIGAQREWGPLEYDDTLLIESAAGGGGPVRILPLMGSIG